MKAWTGKVVKVTKTPWQEVVLWSFKIDQSERIFRMGKKEPDFKEGEWISFEERNSNVHYGSIKMGVSEHASSVTSMAPAAPALESKDAPPSTVKNGSDSEAPVQSAANVGDRIQYQAARRDACNIVVAALHCDHLPHAANVAKGKRLDLLLGYVKEITKELLVQENNNAKK